ncbi:hypothetical protein ABNN70_14595 [Sporolactobacillus sp. Y61]|uniref:Uncharacterized protein n=1 Tax=Sporolactobacillus sp. Y61 TaxID=3160863 RepID=A0AAU8IEV1_9BACL
MKNISTIKDQKQKLLSNDHYYLSAIFQLNNRLSFHAFSKNNPSGKLRSAWLPDGCKPHGMMKNI